MTGVGRIAVYGVVVERQRATIVDAAAVARAGSKAARMGPSGIPTHGAVVDRQYRVFAVVDAAAVGITRFLSPEHFQSEVAGDRDVVHREAPVIVVVDSAATLGHAVADGEIGKGD